MFRLNGKHENPYATCAALIVSLFVILFIRAIVFNHARHIFNQTGTTLSQILRPLMIKKFLHINYVYNEFYTAAKIVN